MKESLKNGIEKDMNCRFALCTLPFLALSCCAQTALPESTGLRGQMESHVIHYISSASSGQVPRQNVKLDRDSSLSLTSFRKSVDRNAQLRREFKHNDLKVVAVVFAFAAAGLAITHYYPRP